MTSLSVFTSMHWRRKWQPTPVFLPGESQGQRNLVAAIYGVTQSRTRLKRLSNSNNSNIYIYIYTYTYTYTYIHTHTYIHTWASLIAQRVKNLPELGLWVEKIPWRRDNSNPLQYSCLENPHGQRNLVGLQSMGLHRVGRN